MITSIQRFGTEAIMRLIATRYVPSTDPSEVRTEFRGKLVAEPEGTVVQYWDQLVR